MRGNDMWTYETLKAEIAGKFKSLKDYKDFARENKDFKYPVSPDLYFKQRGLEAWNAKDFLGEFDEDEVDEVKVASEPTKQETIEEEVSEEETILDEDVVAVAKEMEDFIDDNVEPDIKQSFAKLARSSAVVPTNGSAPFLDLLANNTRTGIIIKRGLENNPDSTLLEELSFDNFKVYSNSINRLFGYSLRFKEKGAIVNVPFHIEKFDNEFIILWDKEVDKKVFDLIFKPLLLNAKASDYKGGYMNFFELQDEEKNVIINRGNYIVYF